MNLENEFDEHHVKTNFVLQNPSNLIIQGNYQPLHQRSLYKLLPVSFFNPELHIGYKKWKHAHTYVALAAVETSYMGVQVKAKVYKYHKQVFVTLTTKPPLPYSPLILLQ